MAAYAVVARIDHVTPRLASRPRPAGDAPQTRHAVDSTEAIDLAGRPLAALLAERWAGFREAWSQTTFYLFDPEGWR